MTGVNWNLLAKQIASDIWSSGKTVSLTEAIEDHVGLKGFSLEDQALLEQFDNVKSRVANFIKRNIAQCEDEAISPKLTPSPVDPDVFIARMESSRTEIYNQIIATIRELPW